MGNTKYTYITFFFYLQMNMAPSTEGWIIIGITGITCGGKTTLANKIREKYQGNCTVLCQDQYFLAYDDPRQVNVVGLDHINKDIMGCMDMEKMYKDVIDIISENKSINSLNILVVEGFCILNFKPIAELCTLRYHITLTRQQCFARRSIRVYQFPDLPEYFDLCVWPEYLKYADELKLQDNIVTMSGMDVNLHFGVLEDIENILNK